MILRRVLHLLGGQLGIVLFLAIAAIGADHSAVLLVVWLGLGFNPFITMAIVWANGSEPLPAPASKFPRTPFYYLLIWPRFLLMYVPLVGVYFWFREVEDWISLSQAWRRTLKRRG